MGSIGAFGVSSSAVGAWAVCYVVFLAIAATLYWLSKVASYEESIYTAGFFGVLCHVVEIIFGICLLVTWWSTPATWATGWSAFGTVLASLIAVAIVLLGPLVAGRVLAKKL